MTGEVPARVIILGPFPVELLAPPVSAVPADPAAWWPEGPHVLHHPERLAMVFRDHGRPGMPWLAALRGPAAGSFDPAFLLDETGRLQEFPTFAAARQACEALLANSLLSRPDGQAPDVGEDRP